MPALVAPTSRVQDSFLSAMAEFQTEGRGGPDDQTMIGEEIRQFSPTWPDPTAFAAYIRTLHASSLENTPRPPAGSPPRRCGGSRHPDVAGGAADRPWARIDRVLITCDVDNVGSRQVIEANGGEFEDQRGGKLRFWVPTKLDAIEITRVE
jgi:hypothetical protein